MEPGFLALPPALAAYAAFAAGEKRRQHNRAYAFLVGPVLPVNLENDKRCLRVASAVSRLRYPAADTLG